MKFHCSILVILALLLSGCLATDGQDSPESVDETPSFAEAPEPVSIEEVHDLALGMPARTWQFNVEDNATTAWARFVLTGPDGAMGGGTAKDYCFQFSTPVGVKSGCPGPGNVIIQVEVLGAVQDRSLFDLSNLDAGSYTFAFEAPPNAAQLHVEAQVQYE